MKYNKNIIKAKVRLIWREKIKKKSLTNKICTFNYLFYDLMNFDYMFLFVFVEFLKLLI